MNVKMFFVLAIALVFSLMVFAASNDTLSIEQVNSNQNICLSGYHEFVDVLVENKTSETISINLFSQSDLFFPQFETGSLSLEPLEQKTVDLKINFNDFFQTGNYSVPVFAETSDGAVVEERIFFELEECVEQKPFELTLDDSSVSIEKFEEKRIYFTVSNNLNEVQHISFSANSDLAVREGQFSFSLGPFESQTSFVEIEARKGDEPETHFIDLFAWSEFGEEKESIDVRVKKSHDIVGKILNENLSAKICSATEIAIFEVELINEGDSDDTVKLSVKNSDETIGVHISEEEIEIKENEKKIVKIIISPSFDTKIEEKEIELIIRGKNFGYREEIPLKFSVIESAFSTQRANLKVVSFPTEINIVGGEEKIINFVIENPTQITALNIVSRPRGIDDTQVVFSTEKIPRLGPNETASIDVKIQVSEEAKSLDYEMALEVFSENSYAIVPFSLKIISAEKTVKTKENKAITSIIGLFGFFGDIGGLGLLLTIVLIIVVTIILLFLLNSSNKQENVWDNFNEKAI